MTQQEAFEGMKNGAPDAIEFIYLQNRTLCVRWALRRLFRPAPAAFDSVKASEEALELYHESIIILVENIRCGRLAEIRVRFSTYLIAVMRNIWRGRNRTTLWEVELNDEIGSLDNGEEEVIKRNVREAIAQLDDNCREMISLRYFMNFEYDDIARVLKYRNGDVVRNLISRCRGRFRELYRQVN